MSDRPDPEPGESRLRHLGREVGAGVEHVVDGIRRRVRGAELGAMEGSPDPLLAAADAIEGAVDPGHEGDRVADRTQPRRRRG